jgi:FAD/FMN-containing dehydrogenase
MSRRELIAALMSVPALSVYGAVRAFGASATPLRRRVRPGERGWPTADQWNALNRQVGGRLIQPLPVLAACQTAEHGASCADVRNQLRNPYFLGDHPAGTQVSGYLDAWDPHASVYAVAARTSADIAAAVNFAREHHLRLVVKGGGHSYQGTSNAPDSLLIWTRHMRSIVLHDSFVPRDCEGRVPARPAVSIDAGAMWMDVYDAVTTKAGRYVQGGGCATVGVPGLIQSGGFGSFSKRYGLAAASLLEAEVVTADGRTRTVNACRDADLFWALKGGGGGTFGVVSRVTLRIHDLPEWFGSASATIHATSDAAFVRLVSRFLEFYATALLNPHWGESVSIRPDNRLEISMVSQDVSKGEGESVWRSFFAWVEAAPNDYRYEEPPEIGVRSARTWWDAQTRRKQGSTSVVFDNRPDAEPAHAWWSGDQEQVSAFLHGYESLWLPATLLSAGQRSGLVAALVDASRHVPVSIHFNKGLAGAPAEAIRAAEETAMNPDVTTAFGLAIVAAGGAPHYRGLSAPFDLGAARRNARAVEQAAGELRRIVPAAGAYVSESSYFTRNWQTEYWGAHHVRLRAIKDKYDPAGLFYVHHGVGSDRWREGGFTPA